VRRVHVERRVRGEASHCKRFVGPHHFQLSQHTLQGWQQHRLPLTSRQALRPETVSWQGRQTICSRPKTGKIFQHLLLVARSMDVHPSAQAQAPEPKFPVLPCSQLHSLAALRCAADLVERRRKS
jgi:hypothetical protein